MSLPLAVSRSLHEALREELSSEGSSSLPRWGQNDAYSKWSVFILQNENESKQVSENIFEGNAVGVTGRLGQINVQGKLRDSILAPREPHEILAETSN